MIAGGRGDRMPCESCAVQFSVFKRKRVCCECERYYCSGCLRRGGGAMCAPCRMLSTRPLSRNTIAHLKVRDLQCFLQRQNISTRGCVEKDELVSLCVSHVNSSAYRRRGARSTSAFSSLKGFTNNINDFLNSAFDLRNTQTSTPPSSCQSSNCFNSAHAHRAAEASDAAATHPRPAQPERFTTTPGGEREIEVAVPVARDAENSTPSSGSERVDTADCFEIEDLDDAGWEFVACPADPLPNDSEVLLTAEAAERRERAQASPRPERRVSVSAAGRGAGPDPPSPVLPTLSRERLTPELIQSNLTPGMSRARASSELELRAAAPAADTGSLRDEPVHRAAATPPAPASPKAVTLDTLQSAAELERLTVKQLKELLARNRVEFRGCLERADLLERAQLLWRDHRHYRDELDGLPLEECCKICMAAPLECVLLECGHIAACTACARRLAECPICRRYVVRAVRCFRS